MAWGDHRRGRCGPRVKHSGSGAYEQEPGDNRGAAHGACCFRLAVNLGTGLVRILVCGVLGTPVQFDESYFPAGVFLCAPQYVEAGVAQDMLIEVSSSRQPNDLDFLRVMSELTDFDWSSITTVYMDHGA